MEATGRAMFLSHRLEEDQVPANNPPTLRCVHIVYIINHNISIERKFLS